MTSSSQLPDTSTSITPLLKSLAYEPQNVSASSIASAFALIFNNSLSTVQMAALLTLLHSTGKDQDPEVLALCSASMREAASTVDVESIMRKPAESRRSYRGGLVRRSSSIVVLLARPLSDSSKQPSSPFPLPIRFPLHCSLNVWLIPPPSPV